MTANFAILECVYVERVCARNGRLLREFAKIKKNRDENESEIISLARLDDGERIVAMVEFRKAAADDDPYTGCSLSL